LRRGLVLIVFVYCTQSSKISTVKIIEKSSVNTAGRIIVFINDLSGLTKDDVDTGFGTSVKTTRSVRSTLGRSRTLMAKLKATL
jgi:hypothetical protein